MEEVQQSGKSALMQEKVVLITGASRGIGAAAARLFGRHGARVGVNYHTNQAEAQQVVQDIERAGGKALAVQADVENQEQVHAMVRQVEERLGPIETLVLNAAPIHDMAHIPFVDYNWQSFQRTVIGELAGVFLPTQAVAPLMIERRRGSIIAIGSMTARRPIEGIVAHATAKSGVEGFVRVLATELGPYGVRINLVAPGLTNTHIAAAYPEQMKQMVAAMAPLRRLAEPEDVAGTIFLLALDEARYLTGNYIGANGGSYMG